MSNLAQNLTLQSMEDGSSRRLKALVKSGVLKGE